MFQRALCLMLVFVGLSLAGCSAFIEIKLSLFPESIQITEQIPSSRALETGETFFTKELIVDYAAGSVFISSDNIGVGEILVDDALIIQVKRADGSQESLSYDFSSGCQVATDRFENAVHPRDITNLFAPGKNEVSISLYDICGGNVGSSSLYLVNK